MSQTEYLNQRIAALERHNAKLTGLLAEATLLLEEARKIMNAELKTEENEKPER